MLGDMYRFPGSSKKVKGLNATLWNNPLFLFHFILIIQPARIYTWLDQVFLSSFRHSGHKLARSVRSWTQANDILALCSSTGVRWPPKRSTELLHMFMYRRRTDVTHGNVNYRRQVLEMLTQHACSEQMGGKKFEYLLISGCRQQMDLQYICSSFRLTRDSDTLEEVQTFYTNMVHVSQSFRIYGLKKTKQTLKESSKHS